MKMVDCLLLPVSHIDFDEILKSKPPNKIHSSIHHNLEIRSLQQQQQQQQQQSVEIETQSMAEVSKNKLLMVAIDESECSHYALEWALDSLHDYASSSPILIFTVRPVSDFSYVYPATLGAASPELVQTIREQQDKVASFILQKAKDICASKGVVAETITESGDPKEAICEAVEKFNVNLLVLGNHGKNALKRAFLGSVSNYCIHNAKCPVLVVKKPA